MQVPRFVITSDAIIINLHGFIDTPECAYGASIIQHVHAQPDPPLFLQSLVHTSSWKNVQN